MMELAMLEELQEQARRAVRPAARRRDVEDDAESPLEVVVGAVTLVDVSISFGGS